MIISFGGLLLVGLAFKYERTDIETNFQKLLIRLHEDPSCNVCNEVYINGVVKGGEVQCLTLLNRVKS